MLRFVLAQLRGRPRRTFALLAGMLVATTGFTVLSAGAAVQQLRVDGAVDANYRSAYDILVRPTGSQTALEDERELVQPNYLSGQYGGITLAQLDRIREVGHVDVAAPVAMLGYAMVHVEQRIDLTDQVDRTATTQLFRLTPTWLADRGLTVLDDAPQYVYLTRNEVISSASGPSATGPGRYADGSTGREIPDCVNELEVTPAGVRTPICVRGFPTPENDGRSTVERTTMTVWRLAPDGRFAPPIGAEPAEPSDRLVVSVRWPVMVLVAAIDPAAEAELVGLDSAVTSGRYLSAADRPGPRSGSAGPGIPALMASRPFVDEQLAVSVERLGADATVAVPDRPWADLVSRLDASPGETAGPPVRSTGGPAFAETSGSTALNLLYQSGPATYRTDADGTLHPRVAPQEKTLWQVEGYGGGWVDMPPKLALQEGFRPVTQVGATTTGMPGEIAPIGVFDPEKIRGFSPLSEVSLQTYQAPQAVGADEKSRAALGDKPLLPNSNPGGYLTTPPLILTNFASLGHIRAVSYETDPISAVRVRVAGVTGVDDRSRELVRVTAERIAAATGLDVDITMGSSPAPQTVTLPAGEGGRPELTLSEAWSKKGVAVAIVEAADRKSVFLFVLILVVCTLFLGNAVTAAVRDRRRDLAVLACLGWPARRLAGVVATEVTLVGLTAGVLGTATALGVSRLTGIPVSTGHAALAVPVGLGIALLAAAPPALAAARSRPGGAVRPPVLAVRRARRKHTVLGLAMANLWRVPGRTALGVVALAIGVGALTTLAVIAVAFRNDVVGSLLGDEVALRVRGVDVAAAVTAIALGVLIVADVLYINVRERAAELAALWAAGWSNAALLRLVGYEGFGLGVLGGVVGAAAGLFGVAAFAGQLSAGMALVATGVAAGAVVVAALAAVVPVLALRRLPLSTLLAEE